MSSPAPTPAPQPAGKPVRMLLPAALAVAVAAAVAGWLGFGARADQALTAAEQLARSVAFTQAAPMIVQPVPAAERAAALQGMKLPADQQARLEQQQGELVYLTLWDDQAEDGDEVTIQSDGFSQSVRLRNAPVTIAIPRPRSGIVTMTGTYDGGGGITVALAAGGGSLPVPALAVGQSIGVPVR